MNEYELLRAEILNEFDVVAQYTGILGVFQKRRTNHHAASGATINETQTFLKADVGV